MSKTDGFVMIPNWLIDDSDLTLHELAVYMVLLRFRDHKTGECFPGLSTIAKRARISLRTVVRTIPELEKKGMIQVSRRKQGTKNLPNVYKVAVPKGAPKRPSFSADAEGGSDTQALPPVDNSPWGSDSQSLGSDSQSLGVVPEGHSNKTHITRSNEQDLTHDFSEATSESFSFDLNEDPPASEAQVNYLKDLATILLYQAGHAGSIDEGHLTRWRGLTKTGATQLIGRYLKELGRPEEEWYPEPGTPAYEQLSDAGKAFADTGGMPESVWEYSFGLKENAA